MPKVLRIGIVQGGRVVKERLIQAGESVTIGESTKNTFDIATPSVSKRYVLFQAAGKGNQYLLQFTEKMEGKVAQKDGIVGLAQVRESGAARKKGKLWQLPVGEKSRGKVVVDGVTVLFQFVPPPPESARMTSKLDFRPKILDEDDPVFLGFLALFTALATVFLIYVYNQEPVANLAMEDIPDRFVEMVIPRDDDKKVPDEKIDMEADNGQSVEKEKEAEASSEKKAEKPKEQMSEAEKAAAEAARQQKMQQEVLQQSKLLVSIMGTRGENNSGQSVVDVFADGDAMGSSLDDALANVGGVDLATGTNMGVKGATDGSRADASIGDLAKGGGGTSKVGAGPGTKVSGKSQLGKLETASGEAADQIKDTVRKYQAQVQACYEQRLKENPNISGRLGIAIDISAGKVTSVVIDSNTTGDSQLEDCVTTKVRRWRFPAEVTDNIFLPFALSPS